MRRGQTTKVVLIVVELGSEWPSWLDETVGVRRVCAEEEAETPASFASRVTDLLRTGEGLQGAVLLCNERADAEQSLARRRTAAALAAALGSGKSGKLVIGAPARAGERLRTALAQVADEVSRARAAAGRVVVTFDALEPPGAASRVA